MVQDGEDLQEVRSALRQLGYLSHGFERFLLQDALRDRRPLRTLARLTAKVAVSTGCALAAISALALALANGSFATPFDLPVLFLHLSVPFILASAAGFLVLSGALVVVLRIYPVRHLEALSLATASVVGVAALALLLWEARSTLVESGRLILILVAVAAPLGAYVLVKLLHGGLLALAIRLTDRAPQGRAPRARWVVVALGAGLCLMLVPVLVSARHRPPTVAEFLPVGPGERVVLLGLDGVLPEELDYLLASGALPTLTHLRAGGGRLLEVTRPVEPPASFWTSVATGVPPALHGVAALESFLPLGVRTPLARVGPLRGYFRAVEVRWGLAEDRPLLSGRRRAFTVWELAARGGSPIAAIDWWSTFPASPLPGLVLAHDGYHLLRSGVSGVVSPSRLTRVLGALLERSARGKDDGDAERTIKAALGAPAAERVLERAVRPDRFYRELFVGQLGNRPRAAALYLAGLDIAAADWHGSDLALADLVREELVAADHLLSEVVARDDPGTIALVFDAGRRREGTPGRLLLWRRSGCRLPSAPISPEAIAAGLARALGLPQSAELPAPPAVCEWSPPGARVAGFGEPGAQHAAAVQGAEYLEGLRALGYL